MNDPHGLLPALRRLGPDGLAALLRDVPGLADMVLAGRGPLTRSWPWDVGTGRALDLPGLARLLAEPGAVNVAIASLDAPALALAHLAVWHGGALTRQQALTEAGGREAVIDRAAALLRARLLSVDEAWVALRPDVARVVGLPGSPVEGALRHLHSDVVAHKLRTLDVAIPSRKGDRIAALAAALRDPDVVERVVAALPRDAASAFAVLLAHGPQRVADLGVPHWPPYGRSAGPIGALMDRTLVGVDVVEQVCYVWLDVLVGLRGGRLFGDAFPASAGDAEAVRLSATPIAVPPVVERLDGLLALWRAHPAPALTAGGLGVRAVRDAAKTLGLPASEVGLLANLAAELGLVGRVEVGVSGRGRNRQVERRWAPTSLADGWPQEPAARRWALLVQAWRDDHRLDEADGLPERRDAGDGYPDSTALLAREAWLRLLGDLPPGSGVAQDAVARTCQARRPLLLDPARVSGLVAAARFLGLVAADGPVGLTEAARVLLEGGPDALAERLPPPATEVIVQADSTVIAPPGAAPEVTTALARWADLESDAGARVYRLSERRLGAALDAGEAGEDVLAWLEEHSKVDVPQNVAYLVRDVARRSGRLRAGTAAAYLRCDDPALLTSAVAVGAAKLRLLAPTVAVSSLAREKLLAALAAKGVSAVAEGADGATVAPVAAEAQTVGLRAGPRLPVLRSVVDPQAVAHRLLVPTLLPDDDDPIERLRRRSAAHAAASPWHELGDRVRAGVLDDDDEEGW